MEFRSDLNGQDKKNCTPPRQPGLTPSTKPFDVEQEKEWTTSKCQRLLRTLTSRVAILRRENSRHANAQYIESKPTEACFNQEVASALHRSKFSDWTNRRKKLKRTYSRIGNNRRACVEKTQPLELTSDKRISAPGEILVETPILSRVREDRYVELNLSRTTNFCKDHDENFNSRKRIRNSSSRDTRQFEPYGSLCDLRHNITATRYNIYEGIYNGLEILLQATENSQTVVNRTGTRSLFETALRTIPQYIGEQQTLLQIHMRETGSKSAIKDRNITDEIYDELESFGSCGNGWKRLRDVARAHGVKIVTDSIKEGLLDFEFCCTLISLCIYNGATEEAETILSSLLSSTTYSLPKTLTDSLCKPIRLLIRFTKQTNKLSFLYREISHLISDGTLPLEWLASNDLGQIWTGLIQSLAPESLEHEALNFCHNTFSLFLKYSNPLITNRDNIKSLGSFCVNNGIKLAVQNTFSSLLTIFLSFVLLDNNSKESSCGQILGSSNSRFGYIVSFLGGCLDYGPTKCGENDQYLLLLVANLIVYNEHIKLKTSKPVLEIISNSLKSTQNKITSLSLAAIFLCQVARCCGRGTLGLGFDYLKSIHLRLKSLDSKREISKFLKRVIVDSAFIFARKVPHHQHTKYANNMDKTYFSRSHNDSAQLVLLSQSVIGEDISGFRWEEGIGEWVTTTPALCRLKRKSIRVIEDPECETPVRKQAKTRQNVTNSVSVVIQPIIHNDNVGNFRKSNEKQPSLKNAATKISPSQEFSSTMTNPSSKDSQSWRTTKIKSLTRNQESCKQEGYRQSNEVLGQNQRSDLPYDENLIHTSQLARSRSLLESRAQDLLNISPNKEASSPGKGVDMSHCFPSKNSRWNFLSLKDDEDELSDLFLASSSVDRNDLTCSRTQKLDLQDKEIKVNCCINHAIPAKGCSIKNIKSNPKIQIRFGNMKKRFLSKNRAKYTYGIDDQDSSEDELCI